MAGLVVDRYGRAVLDSAGVIVDVDVVTEDLPGVALGLGDRRPGEGDHRRVRQRVTQVPGVPVEAVVVAAVRPVQERDAEARRDSVARTSGALTGAYGDGYLAELRADWPE